jgi:uncharacterized protein YcbK (DUF882 family)
MTPEQLATITHFAPNEWRHPEIVDYSAATFLNQLRGAYGGSLVLTSDGRTAAENAASPGSSPTSLHLLGRAFDLRWPGNEEAMWRFLEAFFRSLGWTPPPTVRPVELELVHSAQDQHVHFGFFPNQRPSRLIVAAD